MAPFRTLRPAEARTADRQRRGVVLILTLFVLLITYALVTQLTLGTSVAYQTTMNSARRFRLETACRSAADQILQTLADDVAGSGAAETGLGDPGALGDPLNALGYGQQPSGDPEAAGEEGEEDDGSDSDSWEDGWSRPMRIVIGEVQVMAWVQDENGKFNLHSLADSDETVQQEARERCTRILDRLRDDYEDDLSRTEAQRITDQIAEWLEGRTRNEDDYPRPLRFSAREDSDEVLMYSLEELLLLEDVTPELYFDQLVDEDRIAPGLETVFTVWTAIELSPPEGDEPGAALAETPADSGRGGDESGRGGLDAGSGGDPGQTDEAEGLESSTPAAGSMAEVLNAEPAIGLALNLNTMPRAVLEGLMPGDELPMSVVEEILEFRNEVDEEALEEMEELDDEEIDLQRSRYGEDEPDPMRYFKSIDDLDAEIEGFETRVDPENRDKFLALVGVQSDVFSVYLYARIPHQDWMPETRYEEPAGSVLRMRAVVWRRNTSAGARFVYLQPWHEVPYTRWLIPDFQDRLEPYLAPRF